MNYLLQILIFIALPFTSFLLLILLYCWIKFLVDGVKKQIQESIKPQFIELSHDTEQLKKHAIEYWRLQEKLKKISKKITESENKALISTLNRLGRFFDGHKLRIQDMTGLKYNEGMNVEIVRAEKADRNEPATIIETLEPAIYIDETLVNKSKIIIKK